MKNLFWSSHGIYMLIFVIKWDFTFGNGRCPSNPNFYSFWIIQCDITLNNFVNIVSVGERRYATMPKPRVRSQSDVTLWRGVPVGCHSRSGLWQRAGGGRQYRHRKERGASTESATFVPPRVPRPTSLSLWRMSSAPVNTGSSTMTSRGAPPAAASDMSSYILVCLQRWKWSYFLPRYGTMVMVCALATHRELLSRWQALLVGIWNI